MNAYTTREELALLGNERVSHPEHHADARGQHRSTRRGLVARISAYFERHRVLGELSGLSDRELTDIGLTRSELPSVFEPAFASRHR